MKLTKYLCHVLTIKDMCYKMEFARWLTFIKIVSQVVKKFKKIVEKKIVIKKIIFVCCKRFVLFCACEMFE